MEIVKLKQFDKRIGWCGFIKDFSYNDLKKLKEVLKKYGITKVYEKNISKNPKIIKELIKNKGNLFDYSFLPSIKYLAFIWKGKLNGEEFISLILSNE